VTDPAETTAGRDDEAETGDRDGLGGRRFVIGLYLALVAVAGVMGVLFTVAVGEPEPPALFFLIDLPPTALGFGVYGALTVAVVLGVPLALVVAVSAAADDVDAVGRADGDAAGDGDGDGGAADDGAPASDGDPLWGTEESGADGGRSPEAPKD
jgi:hypothetical protein